MEIGKLPNEILQTMILDKIKNIRKEVIVKPAIGEDCGVIDFGQELTVISTDPVTGTDSQIGTIAVHVACNDIAASGAEPVGIMVTLLAPENATIFDIETIMKQIADTALLLNVDVIGGHTEVTDAVSRFVITITAVGKSTARNIIKTSGAKPGDDIIVTKYAGLEGTAILAFDHEKELIPEFGSQIVINAKKLLNQISVVSEGMIASKHDGVNAMHDVTEGGVLGAVWEMCSASGCGAEIVKSKIPVLPETAKICGYFNINPLKLISSGCMLISARNGSSLIERLLSEGIQATIIGKMTGEKNLIMVTESGNVIIRPPESDELYRAKKV
jgi:hydrogenase expression/formation protein HypE